MTNLAACFQTLGFTEVRTYIKSGNVIFSADETGKSMLTSFIEHALSEAFHFDISVVP